MADQPLGRRTPPDWKHVERYPLRALTAAARPTIVPVSFGTNWYSGMDEPQKVGNRYFIGRSGNLGSIRGGHCYCLKPPAVTDLIAWWAFYDQGAEGACVGFGESRMMTLLNRKRYDAQRLYLRAQEVDEFADTPPGEGTSVRAGLDVLKDEGGIVYNARLKSDVTYMPVKAEGISAFRWATTWDEVRATLGVADNYNAVPFLNSWGRSGFPHITWMTDELGERLLSEEGEAGLITDR